MTSEFIALVQNLEDLKNSTEFDSQISRSSNKYIIFHFPHMLSSNF